MSETKKYDRFTNIKFNGKDSIGYNLYRVGTSGRYEDTLVSGFQDTTLDIKGRDGTIFFESTRQPLTISVDFAYDSVTEKNLREIRQWLRGDKLQELVFSERPYKTYLAKVIGSPSFHYVPFEEYVWDEDEEDEEDEEGEDNEGEESEPKKVLKRVYKGELAVQFYVPYPYAYTRGDKQDLSTYDNVNFKVKRWNDAAGLLENTKYKDLNKFTLENGNYTAPVYNPGDISTPIYMEIDVQKTKTDSSPYELTIEYDYGATKNKRFTIRDDDGKTLFQDRNTEKIIIDSELKIIKTENRLINNLIIGGEFPIILPDNESETGKNDRDKIIVKPESGLKIVEDNPLNIILTYDYIYY